MSSDHGKGDRTAGNQSCRFSIGRDEEPLDREAEIDSGGYGQRVCRGARSYGARFYEVLGFNARGLRNKGVVGFLEEKRREWR